MKKKHLSSTSINEPEFGKNTAILFAALAAYLVVASNQWAGYLLMFAAAILWLIGNEEEKPQIINRHNVARS